MKYQGMLQTVKVRFSQTDASIQIHVSAGSKHKMHFSHEVPSERDTDP